jgi:hypothetical protein
MSGWSSNRKDRARKLLLGWNVGRQRRVAVFEPLGGDAFGGGSVGLAVEVGHEYFEACLRCHAAVAVDELGLLVSPLYVDLCFQMTYLASESEKAAHARECNAAVLGRSSPFLFQDSRG